MFHIDSKILNVVIVDYIVDRKEGEILLEKAKMDCFKYGISRSNSKGFNKLKKGYSNISLQDVLFTLY